MTEARVLVTGAAGKTGRAVISALRHSGVPTRALVHRPGQVRVARSHGAGEVVVGDMRDRAVLKEAADGASAVYHIAPNMSPDEVEIGETLISAARAAGVWRVVYHSVLRPQAEAMPHHRAKLRVEEALFRSGLGVTVLQPGPYMQNLLQQVAAVRDTGRLAVPYSIDVRFGMVDLWDVAAVAVRCVTEPGPARRGTAAAGGLAAVEDRGGDDDHSFAVYELVGPANVSVRHAAGALTEALDRPVRPVAVPLDDWRRDVRAAGLAEHMVDGLSAMFDYYDVYGLPGNGRTLRGLLRRPGTALRECVRREVRDLDPVLR
ncbi:SDR family oxidoreductase [Marinitenerispora sediminis]|uniref:NmrA-like domain-containing protein n=1 Tax=Marinitenerispora sediminis TaxID=1931232 RepID=A0A368T5H9_9ACTN|nr:NmrA family NAD(P)-binding protein [Marinitenerispora sediminis]RCV53303.1 hypothetical protein DEF28_10700 [Marinitenerispora sediminis]RCV58519.1 hypothetical protein DEF23_08605 [Marinitenerispora sediminis]RCV58864.1 hypothetical protein DEF24_11995 [Marinitenerispora sediminis]